MRLALPTFLTVAVVVVAGFLIGGAYLLVLLPLALLIVVGYVAYATWRHTAEATVSGPSPDDVPGGPAVSDDLLDERQSP